jgi:tRNA threonylcarbamoyl adenosine modification protein YeaZ
MRILSFDTSTGALHVSVTSGTGGQPAYEIELSPNAERQEVASQLMPEIDRAMREVGWDKRSLDLIVVGIGPGSFTGIRVAVITARTLAQFLRLPLVGVSLLESYYLSAGADRAAVVISTTSNQFFYGAFETAADDPAKPALPSGFGTAAEVAVHLASFGQIYADTKAAAALDGTGAAARPLPLIKNIGSVQAQLAYDRLSLMRLTGEDQAEKQKLAETFPWSNVLPLYLRSPSVTVKKDYAAPNSPHERS